MELSQKEITMEKVRSVMDKITTGISYVGLVGLLFAMMVTTVDVILGLFSNTRVNGANEYVEIAMVAIMYLGFGHTQMKEGHVRVDMFVNKFPPKVRCTVNGIIMVIVTFFSVLITIQTFKQLQTYLNSGLSFSVTHFPYWPLEVVMFIGMILLTLCFLLRAIEFFVEIPVAKPIER